MGQNQAKYFDAEYHQGTVIELSEVAGPKGDMFEANLAASIDWDRSDAVRSFPSPK